jgi:hypothetical protein
MSILDSPKPYLNPSLWNGNKLIKSVKDEILNKLTFLIPVKLVKQVWFIGSNTGLQYNEYSDIDIGVHTLIQDKEVLSKYQKIFKTNNKSHNFLTDTKHPINFVAMPYKDKIEWGEETYGVYLIHDYLTGISDTWVKPYKPLESIKNPQDYYVFNYNHVLLLKKELQQSLNELYKDFDAYNQDKSIEKLQEVEREIDKLVQYYHEIDSDRKLQYQYGWGVPKISVNNFIYKFLEREGILKKLESLKDSFPN